MRLFVAIEISERAKDAAWQAFAPYRERFPRARWVPRENWHVTVKFLGSTWPRLREWVGEVVGAVARQGRAFETRLDGVGAFPSPRRARVLWAGLEDQDAVSSLARSLDAAFAREFKPESRSFHSHLTVARSDPPLELPAEFVSTELRSEPFRVERLILFRSHLQRPAARYEPVESFPLG